MTFRIQSKERIRLVFYVVDEHDAIGVVYFVLKDAGQKALSGYSDLFAFQACCTYAHLGVALDFAVNVPDA